MTIVGIPAEIKDGECRVGLDPEHVGRLTREAGVMVFVQSCAGSRSGFLDEHYEKLGKDVYVVSGANLIYESSNIIVKVKELLEPEYGLVKPHQAVAGFFHLPANPKLATLIKEKNLRVLPYEDQEDDSRRRPILAVMSKIAGREGAQKAFDYLTARHHGVVVPSRVQALIIGKGNVGKSAAAQLKENDVSAKNIRILDINAACVDPHSEFSEGICNMENVWQAIIHADIVIGAAASLRHGAPKVITEWMIKSMPRSAVLVDVSNDEGGISETCRPTSHQHPTYEEFGVLHYCVPNIPGGIKVAHEATKALSAAAYPYLLDFVKSLNK
jgi:alanine dehydrogenase